MERYLSAKLHGLRVTDAQLNYHGSVTLDPELCREVDIRPLEFVEIWNKHSGARLSTYVIYGAPGSRCCVLNGAAARTCQVGDEVIITSSTYGTTDDIIERRPKVLVFGPDNEVIDRIVYAVFKSESNGFDMEILNVDTGN